MAQIDQKVLSVDDTNTQGQIWKIMVESGALQDFGVLLNKFDQPQNPLSGSISLILRLLVDFSHFIEPAKGNDWSISCFVEMNLITRIVILLERICECMKSSAGRGQEDLLDMIDSSFTILGNITASKSDDKKQQGLRRDLFKRDIFALGTNITEVLERLPTLDLELIKTVAWSFALMTYKIEWTKISLMDDGDAQDFISKIANFYLKIDQVKISPEGRSDILEI